MQVKLIAIDTSKHLFTLVGVDDAGQPVLRRDLRRQQVESFFAKLAPTAVVLEACGGAHHWGRRLMALGHSVRLIPPQHVKPFVKRGKNDRADALAISEAARRPDIRFVAVKPAVAQAEAMMLSVRDLLQKQRTQLVNALRGHAAEFGIIAAKGVANLGKLLAQIDTDPDLPEAARPLFAVLAGQIEALDAQMAVCERKLAMQHKANAQSQLLTTIPGIGPVGALSFALKVDASQFRSGRDFAAWLGLTPKQHSTAGRQRLGEISRQGDESLRTLLVLGATSVLRVVKPGHKWATNWLLGLLARRPRKVAAVALANKMARIVWAMLRSGEAYRQPQAMA